jgi:hypothetical protein
MRGHAKFDGDVILTGASIGGYLEMPTSSFLGTVNANGLSVAGAVLMNDHATFVGEVNLVGAKIGGDENEPESILIR